MHAAGHEVAVAGEPGAWHDRFAQAPWPWIDSPLKGGPLTLMRAARGLRKYLAHHPVDVLHCHYRRTTLVARRLQKTFRAPVLYTLHLSHIPLGGPWGWLSNFGDHVHAPSSEGRQWLIDEARVPADRITLIPHGIHAERFPVPDAAARQAAREKLNLAPEHIVALYLGRLEDPKNESWLVDLAHSSRDSLPGLRLLLAGGGPNAIAVMRQIARLGVADRVRMLGVARAVAAAARGRRPALAVGRRGVLIRLAEAMSRACPSFGHEPAVRKN